MAVLEHVLNRKSVFSSYLRDALWMSKSQAMPMAPTPHCYRTNDQQAAGGRRRQRRLLCEKHTPRRPLCLSQESIKGAGPQLVQSRSGCPESICLLRHSRGSLARHFSELFPSLLGRHWLRILSQPELPHQLLCVSFDRLVVDATVSPTCSSTQDHDLSGFSLSTAQQTSAFDGVPMLHLLPNAPQLVESATKNVKSSPCTTTTLTPVTELWNTVGAADQRANRSSSKPSE